MKKSKKPTIAEFTGYAYTCPKLNLVILAPKKDLVVEVGAHYYDQEPYIEITIEKCVCGNRHIINAYE